MLYRAERKPPLAIMPAAQGPCSELFKYPHSNLYKNAKLRLDRFDRDFIEDLGGVYFIRSGDYVKIGKSRNFSNRLTQLQTSHFNLLELTHSIPIMFDHKMSVAERVLHKYFKDDLTESRNEWFHYRGELKKFVESKPTLHDLIDLISNSSDPFFESQIRYLKDYPSEDAPTIYADESYIRQDASLSAQAMEELQLMLLNYKISKPSYFRYGKQLENWLEFAECFFDNYYPVPSFNCFRYADDRLANIRFEISRLKKIEANGILL